MKAKYVTEIYNLVTPTKANRARSGIELRVAIDEIFRKGCHEHLDKLEEKIRAEELHKLQN